MFKFVLYVFLSLTTITASPPSSASDVVINNLADNKQHVIMTPEFVLSVFTRRKKFWDTGERIVVFIQPIKSIEHSLFVSSRIGISPFRYRKLLKKQLFKGKHRGVSEVKSDAEMVSAVLSTPNSIGYLSSGYIIYADLDRTYPEEASVLLFYYE